MTDESEPRDYKAELENFSRGLRGYGERLTNLLDDLPAMITKKEIRNITGLRDTVQSLADAIDKDISKRNDLEQLYKEVQSVASGLMRDCLKILTKYSR